jgi:formate dehydrogenase subunit gamma
MGGVVNNRRVTAIALKGWPPHPESIHFAEEEHWDPVASRIHSTTFREEATSVMGVLKMEHVSLQGWIRRDLGRDTTTPASLEPTLIFRFTLTVRLVHWWIVATFATALLTGLAMGSEMETGSLFHFHVGAVIAMGGGILVGLIFGNTVAALPFVRDALVPERSDFEFVARIVKRPFRRTEVRWGKFNLGQKGLAWMMLASLAAIIVTGINSWHTDGDASGPHLAAVIVAIVLLSVHVFMAVVNPITRPALPGMVFGRVKRTWAVHHHTKWVDDVDRRASRTATRSSD